MPREYVSLIRSLLHVLEHAATRTNASSSAARLHPSGAAKRLGLRARAGLICLFRAGNGWIQAHICAGTDTSAGTVGCGPGTRPGSGGDTQVGHSGWQAHRNRSSAAPSTRQPTARNALCVPTSSHLRYRQSWRRPAVHDLARSTGADSMQAADGHEGYFKGIQGYSGSHRGGGF